MILRTTANISFILLCCVQYVHAQRADSLKKELAHITNPRQQALLFYMTGDAYERDNNLDSSVLYSNKAIKLATALHDDSIIMESEVILSYNMEDIGKYRDQAAYLDKAISLAKATHNDHRLMIFMRNKGICFSDLTEYTLSLEQCEAALNIALSLNAKKEEANIDNVIASIFININKYDTAFALMNHCITINDSLKDYKSLAQNYGTIMEILGKQKRYKEALKYGLIADSIYVKYGYQDNGLQDKANLAIIYKNMGQYDTAISIYNQILKSTKVPPATMSVYANLGIAFALKGDYKGALKYLFLSEEINNQYVHDQTADFKNNVEIARNYFKLNMPDSALYYGKLSEASGDKMTPHPDEYISCFSLLADIYAAKGDIKNAMANSKKYEALQDSIFEDRQNKNIAEQETRLNLDEKNKELALLAKENELSNIKEQKLAIGLILGALVVIVIIVAYRRAIKNNELLQKQKQRMSEQKDIIDAQVLQLEAAAAMKSKFLANISHELRTPVTLLTGMLEMVKNKIQKNEAVDPEKVAIAFNNSQKLQYMIEEILDLSRVENKGTVVNSKVKEAAPLLKRIVYAFETFINKQGMQLVYNDDKATGVYIAVDEDKFEKIINNLVYNAIKFNHQGGKIIVNAQTATGQQIVITVSDTGTGIKKDELPYIFERFYQGTATNKAKSEGVGIGLSLVKEFTGLLGGTIAVSSIPGGGTIFTLKFPVVKKDMEEEAEIESMPAVQWELLEHKNTVLIVEDNAEMRYYLREILGDKVNIAAATNGKEAIEWMAKHMPDLIISDMMMPEMDGREFVSHIKGVDAYNKIPVITLTALADMENHLTMLGLGVDDYIIKPFNADELRIRVYNLLHNFAARKQFNEEPKEADDIVADNNEANEFREKIKQYVLANLKYENISVGDMARELMLSERQLYRFAKSLTGCSPAQLIKEVRLQKAYELLLSGKITKLDDVAKRVGFETAAYFSRQFLERFGKRPTDYL